MRWLAAVWSLVTGWSALAFLHVLVTGPLHTERDYGTGQGFAVFGLLMLGLIASVAIGVTALVRAVLHARR